MAKKKPNIIRRHQALESTMQKYRDRPFSWEGNATCIHMMRHHLKRMGHQIERVPKLSGPVAAKRELKKRGWGSVAAMLDDLLEPIPVAMMLPGDVSILPDDSGLNGIVISVGAAKIIGWHEEAAGMVVMEPTADLQRAWRV